MDYLSTEFILKFIRFGVVGVSGVFVDFGITYILKELFRLNKYISNSTGFLIATANNYILNRMWTFHSVDPAIALQFTKFLLISGIGLSINNFIIFVMINKLRTNFYLAKAFATVVVMFWNFFANYYYTFSEGLSY
ncbi:MAG: GtrA family protein [Bacteroidota bacterium]|nr:GtrA family protein [Bacteroidota bacterium]